MLDKNMNFLFLYSVNQNLIMDVISPFLQKWMEIIGQAHQNVEFLKDQDVIRTVLNILQV